MKNPRERICNIPDGYGIDEERLRENEKNGWTLYINDYYWVFEIGEFYEFYLDPEYGLGKIHKRDMPGIVKSRLKKRCVMLTSDWKQYKPGGELIWDEEIQPLSRTVDFEKLEQDLKIGNWFYAQGYNYVTTNRRFYEVVWPYDTYGREYPLWAMKIWDMVRMVPSTKTHHYIRSLKDLRCFKDVDTRNIPVWDLTGTVSKPLYKWILVDSGSCGDNLTWTLDGGTLTIRGKGEMGNYTFSNKVPWCGQREKIRAVIIESGVTSIGNTAFFWCSNLTSITIPNSVTSIGESAFNYCTSLTSITIPSSVTSIGGLAFNHCTSLTSITIPNSVTYIEREAFRGCIGLTSITIPASTITIKGSAFANCKNLQEFLVDKRNTRYVAEDGILFSKDRSKLVCYPAGIKATHFTIPSSVTSIGEGAFSYCTGLTSVTIPNSVTSIGGYAFSGCTGLTSITIPNSVTSTGGYAFSGCTGLTSITIPNSVTSIGNLAFDGCTGLTSVTIPNSVTSIEWGTFDGCTSLTSITIPNSVTSIEWWTFRGCTGLTSVTIPNSVTSIGSEAFSGCTSLTSVTIPSSVTSVETGTFRGCTGLKDVYYGGTEEDRTRIKIESSNSELLNATWHYKQ